MLAIPLNLPLIGLSKITHVVLWVDVLLVPRRFDIREASAKAHLRSDRATVRKRWTEQHRFLWTVNDEQAWQEVGEKQRAHWLFGIGLGHVHERMQDTEVI